MQYNNITVKNYTIRLPKCPTFRAIKTGRIDDLARRMDVDDGSRRRAGEDARRSEVENTCRAIATAGDLRGLTESGRVGLEQSVLHIYCGTPQIRLLT